MNVEERPQLGFTLKNITSNISLPFLIVRENEGARPELLFTSHRAREFFGCTSMENLLNFASFDLRKLISEKDYRRISSAAEKR